MYTDRGTLDRLFYLWLDRPLEIVVPERLNQEQMILRVLQAAGTDNWTLALVEAVVEDRPEHAGFQAWARANRPARSPDPAAHPRESDVFDLNELREITEATVGGRPQITFDSVEVGARTATFVLSQQGEARHIVLRAEGVPLLDRAGRERFEKQVRQAGNAASHARVADLLGSGFTRSGQPYVIQVVDQKVQPFPLPQPADEVLDIGAQLADALSVAHSWGAPFGELDLSHVLLGADGKPVLILPQLPMFTGTDHQPLKPHEEVARLCALLLAMLDPDHGNDPLARQLRARLTPAMRGNLIAAALRDQLELLRMQSAPADEHVRVLARYPVNGGSPDGSVIVLSGDLFSQDCDLVIGFSDTFDTATAGSLVISPASLQGQLVERVFGGDVHRLDDALERALVATPVASVESRAAKPHGKLMRYPVGTVAVVEHDGRRIFALAVARMSNNLTTGSNTGFLQRSLSNLWPVIRAVSAGRTVAMPVIGAGLSRVELSRAKLIEMIRASYREDARIRPVCRELRIVAHPSDLDATGSLGVE
jgi:hypothetical protein